MRGGAPPAALLAAALAAVSVLPARAEPSSDPSATFVVRGDSPLMRQFRKYVMLSRLDSLEPFVVEGSSLSLPGASSIPLIRRGVLDAGDTESLEYWEAMLGRLELDFYKRLYADFERLPREQQERLVRVTQQHMFVLEALHPRGVSLGDRLAKDVGALREHALSGELGYSSLRDLYSRLNAGGSYLVPAVGSFGGAAGRAPPADYPKPRTGHRPWGTLDVPSPGEQAPGTADEADVLRIAREQGMNVHIVQAAYRLGREKGVDYRLVLAHIKQESGFNSRAVSPAGAKGLMQLMPATARGLGVASPFNIWENIRGGVTYISRMLRKYAPGMMAKLDRVNPFASEGLKKAVAAYNAGPGNVDKYGDVPPFRETQRYVSAVLSSYERYKRIFPKAA